MSGRTSEHAYGSHASRHVGRTGRHRRSQADLANTNEFRSAYSISKVDRRSLAAAIETRSSGHLIKPLLTATIDDNLPVFLSSMRALNAQSTVSIRFSHGFTPLIVASKYNAVSVSEWICANDKVAIECKDTFGNTALHHAVATGHSACVKILLDAGALAQSQNAEGATPIHFAAYHGNKDAIRRLIAEHPSANDLRDNTEKTPLMLAAFRGRTQIASILLSASAPVNAQDKAGWTALMYAAFTGRIAICRELLEFGASRDIAEFTTGRRAEDLAQESGYYEVVDMLQNKEVSLRTPSLPEGVYMPRFPIAETPLLPPPNTDRAQSSIPQRIRDTVSKASLKYLDSRTNEALKHDAMRQQNTGQTSPLDEKSDAQHASVSSSQRRRAGSAARKKAALTSPYKRYHDSAWIRPYWRIFSLVVTFWMPNIVLNKLLKRETRETRQAWREKIALCFVIVLITALTALVSFGLSSMFCHPVDPISLQYLSEKHGANATRKFTVVRGRIYDVSNPSDAARLNLVPEHFGHDSSMMFAPFPEESHKCKNWPKGKTARSCYSVFGESPRCQSSNEAWNTLKRIQTNKWVVYQWNDVLHKNNAEKLFVYNEHVFSLKPYLASISPHGGRDEYFDSEMTDTLLGLVGTDATIAVSRNEDLQRLVPCWESQLRLGRIEGSTIGCVITSGITISVTVILNVMILIKLICAVLFDWAFSIQLTKITKHFTRGSNQRVPHVLITVTCYDENEATLRETLDSVAMTNYALSRKIMFIIADGEVEASGSEGRTTPEILRSLVVRSNPLEPVIALPYISVGEGPRGFNAAEVTPGSYISLNGIHVPCILIVKVGTQRERDNDYPKAGNRGKRDSQLIILQWLRNVLMNDHLTPLEFELCRAATQLAKINPDQFEYLLMIDADTSIDTECIPRLVAAMERDPGIMGLCGETRIANKRDSWVTRIQVYEYYISHHLSKAFESLWGGVTCLPGCCSMYRIFSRKTSTESIVPLLVAPEVIDAYSSNDTYTLHQKNLLLLGEDRYLTTVLLRAFPKRKLIYVPRAICRTTVPDKFSVLVSQRRRWINSTIHNLLELILVRDLCGTFCCSMQFLVLMDLLGNVVLPSSVIFLFYLIVAECLGLPVALPLLLMAFAFALQGVMILITTQRVSYIYWMFVYIAAIPLWNFVMPIYAFWRFDDFSWGKTRMVGPDDSKADFITDDERLALEPIPLMRWKDWIRDNISISSTPANRLSQQRGGSVVIPAAIPTVPLAPTNLVRTSVNSAGQTIVTTMPPWPAANLPTPIVRLQEHAVRSSQRSHAK
ncbi:ATP-dependent RNA helicase [Coemansia erecta]|uniref:chitin synthase n=1 Tax=Coemansia erecta TaxID=147472 RepID=A0A9W7XXQ2_9FUNG|nr:ATP-dependent RNA helicase [Coemansia erecta]